MKRKRYMSPALEAEGMSDLELLTVSGVSSDRDRGIGYGGLDKDGTKDPSAPYYDEEEDGEDW
jgi:hypothetical protein